MIDVSRRLSRIKLRVTPRRVAVQYIEWMHRFEDEPFPLDDLLSQMRLDIQKKVAPSLVESTVQTAQKEAFFLIEIYGHSIVHLTELICETVHLGLLGYALSKRVLCPDLKRSLATRFNILLVAMGSLDKLETDYLGTSVVPEYLRSLVTSLGHIIEFQLALEDGSGEWPAMILATERACSEKQVQERLSFVSSIIRAPGSRSACLAHKLAWIRANANLMQLILDYRDCVALVEAAREKDHQQLTQAPMVSGRGQKRIRKKKKLKVLAQEDATRWSTYSSVVKH